MKNRSRLAIVLGLFIVLAAGGYWSYRSFFRSSPVEQVESGTEKAVYVCPMHPNYTSDQPGECPICGMTLIKMEPSTTSHPSGEHETHQPDEQTPAGLVPVHIDSRRQQLIGVVIEPVRKERVIRKVRTVGYVTYDETLLSHVHTKIHGWIERIYVDFTGQAVKKGQPLIDIYSPELLATQEEYLRALNLARELKASARPELVESAERLIQSARERLLLWDIPVREIELLEKTGKPRKTLTLFSPVSGYVIEKKALLGMEVNPQMELYTIADLSRVWVEADVYEYEIPFIHVGMEAHLSLSYVPGKTWTGTVEYVYPYLDPKTRTNKVRFSFPNPTGELKPGMYANVELNIDRGEQLVVPDSAVLDTGIQQYVFVAVGDGYFHPRLVKIGEALDGRRIIVDGLKEGERVVVSGNFLIDSESRLKAAMQGMTGSPGGHEHGH